MCLFILGLSAQEKGQDKSLRIISPLGNNRFEITELTADSIVLYKGQLSSLDPEIKSGMFRFFNEAGQLHVTGQYDKNIPLGDWTYFGDRGDTLFTTNYSDVLDFLFKERSEYTLDGTEFRSAETGARFNGGEPSIEFTRYIKENLIYPQYPKLKGVKGIVEVQFAVDTLGKVRNPQIIQSSNLDLNMEAIRVISQSPSWQPGLVRGEPVTMLYTWPIVFPTEDQAVANSATLFEDDPTVDKRKPRFKGINPLISFRMYIEEHLEYPESALEKNVAGRVIIRFTVNTDGSLQNANVIHGVSEVLDKEAIRVVMSSPKWEPGYAEGKPVAVDLTFPVNFIPGR